jgi:hypothetical protein
MLQKEVGLPIEAWIKRYLTDERYKQTYRQYAYVSSYISTMFKGDRDATRDLQEKVDITMKSVGRSAAIPNNLKIGKGRQFSSGEYIIPEMDIPEDAYFVGDEPMTS